MDEARTYSQQTTPPDKVVVVNLALVMKRMEGVICVVFAAGAIASAPSLFSLAFPLPVPSALLAVPDSKPQRTQWSCNLRWDTVGPIRSKVQVQS